MVVYRTNEISTIVDNVGSVTSYGESIGLMKFLLL